MLGFLADLLGGVLGFLQRFLPDSPFQSIIEGTDSLRLGLGWLNWVLPVGDCLAIAALWLAALVVWIGVRLALGKTMDMAGRLV